MHQFSEAQNGKLIGHAHTFNNLIDGEKKWERQILPEQFSSKIPDYMYTQKWQLFLDIIF